MLEVYQPPSTTESSNTQECDFLHGKQKLWRTLKWISFGLLLLIPINGIFASGLAMQRVFTELSQTGAADPSELANKISVAMLTAFWACLLTLPVFIFWIFAIIRHRKWKKSAIFLKTAPSNRVR